MAYSQGEVNMRVKRREQIETIVLAFTDIEVEQVFIAYVAERYAGYTITNVTADICQNTLDGVRVRIEKRLVCQDA